MITPQTIAGPRTPGIYNLLEFGFAPRRFAVKNRARFGHVYRVSGPLGDVIFTTDPEHIRKIFAADSDTFRPFIGNSLLPLFGSKSVLLTSGSTHKRQRKLLSPLLTGARLRALGDAMQSIADAHVHKLSIGEELKAHDLSTRFTLDVILRTVFGVCDADEERRVGALLSELVHAVPAITVFAPALQRRWFLPWNRFLKVLDRFNVWVTAKIEERRHQARGTDVMSLLLDARYEDGSPLAAEEIRDQLTTLLLAGHETTSIALAQCLQSIHRHPEVLTKLRAELSNAGREPEAVQRLPYLTAVIDETLRLEPIVSDVPRVPLTPFALGEGHVVMPGEVLIALVEGVHLDPQLYPDPLRFRPERFLERKFAPHEYLPFGGGVRRCLGAAFSDYETKIFLATLLRERALKLTDKQPEQRVRRNITMGPKHGVGMRVEARL